MITQTYNQLHKSQQRKLIPDFFKKGIISKVNTSSKTVDVYFVDNPQNIIKNVPLANGVSASIGMRCKVDLFDESNPNDMVVAYCY